MKYFFLILLSCLSIGFLYAQRPAIEKGFAFVQSRIETNEPNILKGKQVLPTVFAPNKPIYPIKKQGQQKQGNSNAVYIQTQTELRLFVFPNGFPQNFNLQTFNPSESNKKETPESKSSENKDILLDVNLIDTYYTVMMPATSTRSQVYFERSFQSKAYLESKWRLYRVDNDMFHYKKCIDGYYNINELKGISPNSQRSGILGSANSLPSQKQVAIVEPQIKINNQWVGNNTRRNNREDYANNFQDLTPNNKVLILAVDGKLDLEKSWKLTYYGQEQCNKVGYRYDNTNYLMFFRYVRRNANKINCSGSGQDCHTSYVQNNLIIPTMANEFNTKAMIAGPTLQQIIDTINMAGGPPSEGDVAGIPKPE